MGRAGKIHRKRMNRRSPLKRLPYAIFRQPAVEGGAVYFEETRGFGDVAFA